MVTEGSSLLLVLVTVLGSSNRTKHLRDLPVHVTLSGNTHTVFDDVDAAVSDAGLSEESKNKQFVKTCGYESPFYLNGGSNMVLQPCRESLSWDYLGGRRMKKTNRYLRLLHCSYNKVSRYKHSTLLTGVFPELYINNRYRRIAIGYGFHGILQIMVVAKGSTSNVTCESCLISSFTFFTSFENCLLRSESLWSLCRLFDWFVSFQSNLYVTIVNHIALFSFVAYFHCHKTRLRLRNDVDVMYRIITKFTLTDIVQVADSCFNIGKKYIKQYVDLENSYYNLSTFYKHDFLDLFSHLPCPSLQAFSNIFPQTVLAYPLTGSLNAYLTRVQNGPICKEDEMCYEVRRLQSFNGVSILQSRIKLARSGFYATGNQDETRCYSCGVTHRKWEMKNLPEQIHRRLYPGCPHLTSGDPRNIPISSPSDESSDRIVGVLQDYPISIVPPDTTGQLSPNSSASDSTQPADASRSESSGRLDISRAVYPQFKDRQSRRESFRDWRFSHVQDPETLIAAGFYFAGYRDCVRCFYCGVGLKTWEEQDDPWVMHVRWRSSCDYVREIRGEQFIQHALSHNLPGNSTSTNPTSTATESQPMSDQQSSSTQQVQTVQDMSYAVGRAVEMGFERGAIETALSELDISNTEGIGHSDGVSLERLIESLILKTSSTSPTISRHEESRQRSSTQQSEAGKESEAESGTPNPSEPAAGESITRAKHVVNSGRESVVQGLDQRRVISPAEERRLAEENESLREENTCKICMDNPCCIVFLPCGHLVTCAECAPALRRCPICRSYIRGSVRVQTTDRL